MQNITAKETITINAHATRVWEVLTSPELIKKYFFGTEVHSDWKVGNPLTWTGEYQGKKYVDKGTILEVNPCKTLRYSYWSSMSGIEDKPENYVPIIYSLSESNGITELIVTQENIPDEKMKESSIESWNKVLEGLKKVVEEEMVHTQ